jgi:hypothetical protein
MKATRLLSTPRRLVILLAVVLLAPSVAPAQDFFDYIKEIEYGGGLVDVGIHQNLLIGYNGDTLSSGEEMGALGFASTLGWNFPVYHPDTGSAIGFAPAFEASFSLSMFTGTGEFYYSLALPVLITYKRGGDAEYHNQKGWGMTAGVGGVYGFFIPSGAMNSEKSPFVSYSAPIGMLEVNYAKRDAIVKLRYQTMFSTAENSEKGYTYFQHGLYLVFSAGFWGR